MKALVLTALALTLALPARAVDLGSMTGRWSTATTQRLMITFPAGTLTVQSGEGPDVVATLSVRCRHGGNRCLEEAKRIRLVTDLHNGTRTIRFEPDHWSGHGLQMELTVEIPAHLNLGTQMGAGELSVYDLTGEVELDLGAGQASLRLPDRAVHSVDAAVGIGDATLRRHGSSVPTHGFLSKELHWNEGPGASRVKVNVGVGDINLRLD